MEFLTDMITTVPDGITDAEVEATKAREAVRAAELIRQGRLLRLWKPTVRPDEWRTLGLYQAADEDEMRQIMESLPLHPWMQVDITPLAPHPSDPGTQQA